MRVQWAPIGCPVVVVGRLVCRLVACCSASQAEMTTLALRLAEMVNEEQLEMVARSSKKGARSEPESAAQRQKEGKLGRTICSTICI